MTNGDDQNGNKTGLDHFLNALGSLFEEEPKRRERVGVRGDRKKCCISPSLSGVPNRRKTNR